MSKLLLHPRDGMLMEALYAAPSSQIDLGWLVRQPLVLNGFHEALKGLIRPLPRLLGLALCARLCLIDLKRTRSPVGPSCQEDRTSGQSYCDKAQSDGLFNLVYNTLEDVLKVIQLSESGISCRLHYRLHDRLCILPYLEAML